MERKHLFGDLIATHDGLAEELQSILDVRLTSSPALKDEEDVKIESGDKTRPSNMSGMI